jgi:hypothetical protein
MDRIQLTWSQTETSFLDIWLRALLLESSGMLYVHINSVLCRSISYPRLEHPAGKKQCN